MRANGGRAVGSTTGCTALSLCHRRPIHCKPVLLCSFWYEQLTSDMSRYGLTATLACLLEGYNMPLNCAPTCDRVMQYLYQFQHATSAISLFFYLLLCAICRFCCTSVAVTASTCHDLSLPGIFSFDTRQRDMWKLGTPTASARAQPCTSTAAGKNS